MTETNPIVFLHYSWDDENHKEWVLFLASRLVADGVEVIFDRYDLKLGSNNYYFMEKIEHADKVILITTPKYKEKADKRSSGIGYEYQIITTEVSKTLTTNNKFITILRNGTAEDSIPKLLQSFIYLDMTEDKSFEVKYLELLKDLYDYPTITKPEKGEKPNFGKLEKQLKKKSEPKINKLFKLGITKKQARRILGEPENNEELFENYWSHGLQVYYNRHWDKVDGIMIKRQPSGISYDGEVIGIKLGESFAEIKSKLGNPINWGLPNPYTSFAFYEIKNKFLTVALWRDKPEGNSIDFKLGSAYAIGYSEKHSVIACEAIVAITIEQIRAKRNLTYLENESDTYGIDFTSDFFHENYTIFPTQSGIFGGYFVSIVFEKSKIMIEFWLYDLAWSYLAIRMIIKKENELKDTKLTCS